MTNALITDREASAMLGCARSTIWRWASAGTIPQPLKIGGLARWQLSDIEAVVEAAQAEREAA